MASLVCWASGMLEVVMDKDVPAAGGPIVVLTGTAGRLRSEMTAIGQYLEARKNWYVPGTADILDDHARMLRVVEFGKQLEVRRLKKKGRAHLIKAGATQYAHR